MVSKICVLYKIVKEQSQKYSFDLIPSNNNSYQKPNSQNLVISQFKVINHFFLNSFFPLALVKQCKLSSDICNPPPYPTHSHFFSFFFVSFQFFSTYTKFYYTWLLSFFTFYVSVFSIYCLYRKKINIGMLFQLLFSQLLVFLQLMNL